MKTEHADLSSLTIDKTKRNGNGDNTPKKSYGWLVVLIILVGFGFYAGRLGWQSIFSKPVEVELVKASFRSPTEQQSVLNASGYVVAQRKAAVASKATGLMVQLNVREGDRVRENQILARLQDNDIRALLAEARASLALSEADLVEAQNNVERQNELFAQKVVTDVEVERAETNLKRVLASIDIAKARVTGAEVALENTIIRAPFDGTVLTKNADVGEIVAPMAAGVSARAAVVTIADLSSLQVEADVSESNIQKIKLDQSCEVRLDAYPGVSYNGYVASIIPTADRSKGTVMVKIGFREYDSKVLPEMSAKVTFLKDREVETTETRPAVLTVPDESIATREGKQLVFTVKNEIVKSTVVQTGEKFNGYTEIRNGITDGESVIRNVDDKITDGLKVKVQ